MQCFKGETFIRDAFARFSLKVFAKYFRVLDERGFSLSTLSLGRNKDRILLPTYFIFECIEPFLLKHLFAFLRNISCLSSFRILFLSRMHEKDTATKAEPVIAILAQRSNPSNVLNRESASN